MRSFDLSRRHFFRVGAVSVGLGVSGWMNHLVRAADAADRRRSCILLWMNGGPSTIDLWDVKVGHANGGPMKEIPSVVPGLPYSEYLPKLAKHADRLAILRGMSTKEGDHERATYQMLTGNLPQGPIQYPTFGSLVSKEIGDPRAELPNFISVAPRRFFFGSDPHTPGFLGPQHAPLLVGQSNEFFNEPTGDDIGKRLKVENIDRPKAVDAAHADGRLALLRDLQDEFAAARPSPITASHASAYDRASRLMASDASKVFDLSQEKKEVRERYGKSLFGQGCLLARRLVEKGVAFVEVSLGGWDTHQRNFDSVKTLAGHLDAGWSALMADLKDRGLLDTTTIVWMGEFGRTPRINPQQGRDHYPNAWATVVAGGGVKGGQAVGRTSKDGTTVEERPTSTGDLLATVCKVLGVDHEKQNLSNVGRPIRIVEKGAKPVAEVIA
jgi:hypothetical protein